MASPALKTVLTAAAVVFILCNIGLTPARARSAVYEQATPLDKEQHLKDSHEDDWRHSFTNSKTTDHDHDHDHEEESCPVTAEDLAKKFTEVSEKMHLVDSNGDQCGAGDPMVPNTTELNNQSLTCSSCGKVYELVQQLLVDLDTTEPCCLGNDTTCGNGTDHERTDPAKAYGYGFLMVLAVSLLSLLGVLFLPLLNKNRGVYLYCNTLLIAMGTSALFCSAVLHLLPKAIMLDHSQEQAFIWRGVVIIGALYLLYLFEVTLHSCSAGGHAHSHNNVMHLESREENSTTHTSVATHDDRKESSIHQSEVAVCTKADKTSNTQTVQGSEKTPLLTTTKVQKNEKTQLNTITKKRFFCGIKPFAWTILLGDAFHNFADGLTVGAAISQSLSLGVSTTVAIAFHEIPHEVGDFAILLSTGLPWYVALLLNFLSSLTAIVGFFVGVAIGTSSVESNNWILTAAVGLFLYVALVDLLPELIHFEQKGCTQFILIILSSIGFFISFAVLLPIAVFEDKFDDLINIK